MSRLSDGWVRIRVDGQWLECTRAFANVVLSVGPEPPRELDCDCLDYGSCIGPCDLHDEEPVLDDKERLRVAKAALRLADELTVRWAHNRLRAMGIHLEGMA